PFSHSQARWTVILCLVSDPFLLALALASKIRTQKIDHTAVEIMRPTFSSGLPLSYFSFRMKTRTLAYLLVLAFVALAARCSIEAKKKRYLAHAEKDFQTQQYDRAEIEYRAALTIPPPNANALIRL